MSYHPYKSEVEEFMRATNRDVDFLKSDAL